MYKNNTDIIGKSLVAGIAGCVLTFISTYLWIWAQMDDMFGLAGYVALGVSIVALFVCGFLTALVLAVGKKSALIANTIIALAVLALATGIFIGL